MAPPKIDLDRYREEINHEISIGRTHDQIRIWLARQGTIISKRALIYRLNEWGMKTVGARLRSALADSNLVDAVKELFQRRRFSDTIITDTLRERGVYTTPRQVKTIRLKHGLVTRTANGDDSELYEETLQRCYDVVAEGGRGWGRGYLRAHLRVSQSFYTTYSCVQRALRVINQSNNTVRQLSQHTRRHEAVYPGVDWVWSVDGHAKLQNYGIEIYGAIDGYSRRIVWLYVGVSGFTQVSVQKQYLQAILRLQKRPLYIRSDRGVETMMMADIHYSLHRRQQISENLHNQEDSDIPLRSCYLYGKSTTNQRIESFWRHLIQRQTQSWMVSDQRAQSETIGLAESPRI